MDTAELAALAQVVHSETRRLYRQAESLRRLTAGLVDATQTDTPTEETDDGKAGDP